MALRDVFTAHGSAAGTEPGGKVGHFGVIRAVRRGRVNLTVTAGAAPIHPITVLVASG